MVSISMAAKVVDFDLKSRQDGLVLKLQHVWANGLEPYVDAPRSIVVMVHGYGDHREYYLPLAEHLAVSEACSNSIVYDQRGHGIYFKNNTPPSIRSTKLFEEDLLEILEHLRRQYADTILYVYGHSMGGAIAASIALLQPARVREIKIAGFIFESPFFKIHPDAGHWCLIILSKLLGHCVPGLTFPDETKPEDCVRDPTIREIMSRDTCTFSDCRADTAMFFINKATYFAENLHNWPKEFSVQLNIPFLDHVCDNAAAHKFFDCIGEKHPRNEKHVYAEACHDIKGDLDDVRKQFFDNVSRYICLVSAENIALSRKNARFELLRL